MNGRGGGEKRCVGNVGTRTTGRRGSARKRLGPVRRENTRENTPRLLRHRLHCRSHERLELSFFASQSSIVTRRHPEHRSVVISRTVFTVSFRPRKRYGFKYKFQYEYRDTGVSLHPFLKIEFLFSCIYTKVILI